MNKKHNIILFSFLSASLFLTSCTVETDQETFTQIAKDYVSKGHTYNEAEADVKGYFGSTKYDISIDFEYNQNSDTFELEYGQSNKKLELLLFTYTIINLSAEDINDIIKVFDESDTYKYYKNGSGLKIVGTSEDEKQREILYFNSRGLVTRFEKINKKDKTVDNYKITFEYSKD